MGRRRLHPRDRIWRLDGDPKGSVGNPFKRPLRESLSSNDGGALRTGRAVLPHTTASTTSNVIETTLHAPLRHPEPPRTRGCGRLCQHNGHAFRPAFHRPLLQGTLPGPIRPRLHDRHHAKGTMTRSAESVCPAGTCRLVVAVFTFGSTSRNRVKELVDYGSLHTWDNVCQ